MDFEILRSDSNTGSFAIPLPGTFNVQNALGAIIVARDLGIPDEVIRRALSTFKSVKRRLEIRGEVDGIVVYDDFAHHPTAVHETLRAVRERHPDALVCAVFEPRSQTFRRRIFEQAFLESSDPADTVVIARVYGASHLAPAETLSPDRVAEGIRARGKRAFTFASTDEIVSFIATEARSGSQRDRCLGTFQICHRKQWLCG